MDRHLFRRDLYGLHDCPPLTTGGRTPGRPQSREHGETEQQRKSGGRHNKGIIELFIQTAINGR